MSIYNSVFDTPTTVTHQAQDYIYSCRSESTRIAYQRDWNHFCEWCSARQLEALPATPNMIAEYLTDMAELYKPITLGRRLASISVAHQMRDHSSPTTNMLVRNTLSGIRRRHGVATTRKTPIRASNLRQAMEILPNDLTSLRNKALLMLGYMGALRRSELVAINVDDIEFVEQGMRLTLRRSKTDQEGRGITMGIGYGEHARTCPVKALQSWLDAAKITDGPVFRAISRHGRIRSTRLVGRTVATIIKSTASKLDINPDTVSGHSLRSGFITDQYAAGTAEAIIMERSRHKSHSVMSIYRREADMFAFNYTAAVGL